MIKGQIIGGDFEHILVRQKNDVKLEIGELLVSEQTIKQTPSISQNQTSTQTMHKVLFQVVDSSFGSQISTQNLELMSGMHLEENQPITLFEEHLRTYTLVKLKILLNLTENKLEKSLPRLFSTVRNIQKEDLTFLHKKTPLNFGYLRSGSTRLDESVCLNHNDVLSHHVLIAATTGKGKSNLMKHLLYTLTGHAGLLVLDPHDEYFGRNNFGLKDHPKWNESGKYYTFAKNNSPNQSQQNQNQIKTSIPPGANKLVINIKSLEPKHFQGILDLSQVQFDLLYAYHSKFDEDWIEHIIKKSEVDHEFHEATYGVVQRRISQALQIREKNDTLYCNGIFQNHEGETTISEITKRLEQSQTIIIDTSHLTSTTEILVGSLLTSKIFDTYRNYKTTGELESKPIISVVLEEAPRVIGKEVLDRGPNVFSTIAKEGRKFKIGLCAITQLPSLIPKTILANMNTKIIMGLELSAERNAIIESAAQDLSMDSRNIASLDKGEAIISSNFARIATPIKVPLFTQNTYAQIHNLKDQTPTKPKLFGL
jgi:uncharacterized protein